MDEIELEDLIHNLFENEPQPVKSLNVVFEDSNLKKLFESLLMIFTLGMKKHFGNSSGQVDLTKLTEDNIIFFNRYMNSFGIQLFIEIEQYSILMGSDYESLKYTNIEITNNTKLNELKLPFLSKGLVYIISFDFI